MAMSKKNKKLLILLAVIVALYIVSTTYGLMREDSTMGKAMVQVRQVVAETRQDIQKEMDKPFILRLFGSLFGMEGNSFQKMKEELPRILKDAMPTALTTRTVSAPDNEVACVGMRLGDALKYLHDQRLAIGSLTWTYDDTLSGSHIQLSGSILGAWKDADGKAVLVLQMPHSYNGESGLGTSPQQMADARLLLQTSADQHAIRHLADWFSGGQQGDAEAELLAAGVPLVQWKTLPVTWVASAKAP